MTRVFNLELRKAERLRKALENQGFQVEGDSSAWRAFRQGMHFTFYSTGRLVVQGKEVSCVLEALEKEGWFSEKTSPPAKAWIGTDEAGKGDYFGPLVAAAVLVRAESQEELRKLGVRDSKKLSDGTVQEIAENIQKHFPHAVVVLSPKKYNELYARMRNLNRLLAWAHGRAVENILEKHPCDLVVSDQFGDEKVLQKAMLEKGRKIPLVQRPRAEDDLAVAAASILARAEFLKRLEELSRKYGISLPKGATHVIEAARAFVRRHGKEKIEEVAKVHFKTTREVFT